MFDRPNRFVDRVFCTARRRTMPTHDNIATIERWHREREFNGIGYHYFISKDGELHDGRSLEKDTGGSERAQYRLDRDLLSRAGCGAFYRRAVCQAERAVC